MPHCILEYSNNIVDQTNFQSLLLEVNKLLAGTGMFRLGDIKSRVTGHDLFVIGDGVLNRTFITINICILAGREDAVKAEISHSVLRLLARYFPKTVAEPCCSLTVRITDMDPESYGRAVSNEAG
jgi:5-carboxymethyl-2-hydroxymuconate isomerase